jgi:hypothetical protein
LSELIFSKRGDFECRMKMINRAKEESKKPDIYEKYRRILNTPSLTNKEIDEMRKHLTLLAQTICEHVWRKKFY